MEGVTSKLGKTVPADVWPEDAVVAGRIGMRQPRTVDTTAEIVQPRLGFEGPFPSVARGGERIGMSPQQALLDWEMPVSGQIVGTPSTASPFPASLVRRMQRQPGVNREQVSEAINARSDIADQIRRQQMERMWEEQELMGRLGL